ncbi:MAG: menaquinone reductase molybdopterin-binding-like subunit QrcB [Desulfobacterales bacterium]|nr:menaquinone reductase molybdopterin-binding-like subunit QrcB [Desulfobacterales bacterium]
MKIDRRCFLSLGLGAAVGTALSPLPWKMADDSAIWTQMWPWTSVPPDGAVSYVNSACTLCPGGCGITVRKVEGRAVKIEGLPDHPVNRGGICLLGLSGLQLLYGPLRVRTPLKRVGQRGEGRWKRISWDEALSEVAQRLADLRSNGQSHAVAAITTSARGTVPGLLRRLLTVYGSPNFMRTPSMEDSFDLTLRLMHGTETSAGFDIENAGYVLSFGSGIIDGWGSPVRMFRANSARIKRGGKLIQIEPRLSNTAAKSDRWVPVRPGTEGALALGLAHVIISESLYNKDFVENYAVGFDNWIDDQGDSRSGFKKRVLDLYPPKEVSRITGIDQKTIYTLARDFAGASTPLAVCGKGHGRAAAGSLYEFMAVHALNALVGNINKPGGVWPVSDLDTIRWPAALPDSIAAAGLEHPRIDGAGGEKYPAARYLLNRFAEEINASGTSPVQALLCADGNPLYSLAGRAAVQAAFDRIPFIASFSSYMDETAARADMILPNHCYLERYEDIPSPVGLPKPVLGLSRPVVPPQFNTRHIGDAILGLAKALGGTIGAAFPWDSYQTCLTETLATHWAALNQHGFWTPADYRADALQNTFGTARKKFNFSHEPDKGAKRWVEVFPHYLPVSPEGNSALFPLMLIPFDSMRLALGTAVGDPPFVIKTVPDTVLKDTDVVIELNPETARKFGFSEGQNADLTTPAGQARVKIHLFDGIMPGVVGMPRGLGHTAFDKHLAGKGKNINDLIKPVEDHASGHDAAWGIRANLSRV